MNKIQPRSIRQELIINMKVQKKITEADNEITRLK